MSANRKTVIIIGLAVVLVLAMGILGYLVFIAPVPWKESSQGVERGVENGIYPWLGAREPEMVIHEYFDYDCSHCITSHRRLRSLLARHFDKVRLVRHNYARMKCRPNSAKRRLRTCELVRAAICASRHVDFWKWNDAVVEVPRAEWEGGAYADYVPWMISRFGIPKEQFDACLYSEETIDKAQRIYLDTRKAGVQATPVYLVENERVDLKDIHEMVNDL